MTFQRALDRASADELPRDSAVCPSARPALGDRPLLAFDALERLEYAIERLQRSAARAVAYAIGRTLRGRRQLADSIEDGSELSVVLALQHREGTREVRVRGQEDDAEARSHA